MYEKKYLLLCTMFLIVILASINFVNAYETWTKLETPKVNMNVEVKAWCKDCGGAGASLTVKYEDNTNESWGCDFREYVNWQGKTCYIQRTTSSSKRVVAYSTTCQMYSEAGSSPDYNCIGTKISGGTTLPNYQTYTMDILYNGNTIIQSTDQITSNTNYTLKSIKFCKKQTDTNNYTIEIGKNFQNAGTQTGTSGCTIIK